MYRVFFTSGESMIITEQFYREIEAAQGYKTQVFYKGAKGERKMINIENVTHIDTVRRASL